MKQTDPESPGNDVADESFGFTRLKTLVRSPALGVAFIHGVSGLAFVVANLLFARALEPEAYGQLALVIAIVNLAMPLAPAGADGVVNRRPLPPDRQLLLRVLMTSAAVAGAACIIGSVVYDLREAYLMAIGSAVLGGGLAYLAAAQFQSRQHFAIALAISQSVNGVLVLAGIALLLGMLHSPESIAASMAGGLVLAAVAGWILLRLHPAISGSETEGFDWWEALSYAGVSGAILLLLQLERLLIPTVLTLEDLATFGVLASIVGAPFRMMQQGLGFTLFPRLRAAESVPERRSILFHEGLTGLAVVLAGGTAIWFATPHVVDIALDGKYHLPDVLIIAALVSGTLKVLDSFAKSSVSALGTVQELSRFNFLGWGAVSAGAAAAILGGRWGLVGVIYGVGLGWASRAVVGGWLAVPYLRSSSSEAAEPGLDDSAGDDRL